MSLTGRIECDKELNEILDMFDYSKMLDEVNKYDFRTDLKIKRKLSNIHLYSYLGYTFDYMCRFILQKFQYKYFNIKVDDIYKLVAKRGYDRLELDHNEIIEKYKINYVGIIDFIYNNYVYNNDVKIYDYSIILPYAYNLSKLEEIYRNCGFKEFEVSVRFPMGRDSIWILEDLLNLFIKEFDNKFKLRENNNKIIYNPSFGKYSRSIGGADADIIINDTLIDFKTSSFLNYNNSCIKNLKQLVGYYLLNYLNKGDSINTLSLYYARYGIFIEKELTIKEKSILKRMSEIFDNYCIMNSYERILQLFETVINEKVEIY